MTKNRNKKQEKYSTAARALLKIELGSQQTSGESLVLIMQYRNSYMRDTIANTTRVKS